jgi:hypothetical protein
MLCGVKITHVCYLMALLLSGCALADFEPYSGQQQNWPTSPGTFVNNTYVIPTYFGYPPRPYSVIGYLDATTAPIRHRGAVAFAARRAKELGADAIIVLNHGTEYAGTISTGSAFTSGQFYGSGFNATTTGTGFSGPLVFGKASIILIKWR